MTDKKLAWQKANKALKEQITDLRTAIAFTISPDFPAPNDDAARLAYLRAWWGGETMRMEVAEEPPSAKEDFQ